MMLLIKKVLEAQRTQGVDSVSPCLTFISYKFGHQVAPLALITNKVVLLGSDTNMATIGSNFGHLVALLACITKLVIRWRPLHCHIDDCPIDMSWCLHQPESHHISISKVTDRHPNP